jgi:outer membrane protein assembly factor BamB
MNDEIIGFNVLKLTGRISFYRRSHLWSCIMQWIESCILLILLCLPAAAENWPQFRGPTGQGVSAETDLPLEWSRDTNVAWKTAISGEAWSSPIVWEDRVFVTTATDGGVSCRIMCLDAASGEVLWETPVFEQETPRKEDRNSYATPTPATDGQRVYAVFGGGGIAAVHFDGTVAWTNEDFPFYSQHGLGSSPILYEDMLILARDGSSEGPDKKLGWQIPWDQSFVMALDTGTGKVRWKTGRGLSRIAHVTPNLWREPGGRTQLISGAGDVVQGFDARTGERLWTSTNIGEGVVPSIVLGDGLAFTCCGWGGRESTKAFRLGGHGDLEETNIAWEQPRAMPRIPSFVYVDGLLFGVTENGVALCLDGQTGDFIWQERLGGEFGASPICADGRIYYLSEAGETIVVAADRDFKILARNPLGEKAKASMAVSNGRLFIRTASSLYAIGE